MNKVFLISILLLRSLFFSLSLLNLETFFNSTYIRKETGEWSPVLKRWSSEGFNPQWNLFHFHHACVRKGDEAIYIGLKNVPNRWKDRYANDRITSHFLVSDEEWNEMRSINDLHENLLRTYRTKKIAEDDPLPSKVHFLEGSTYFFNCADKIGVNKFFC